jgi:hypothetical protein
MNELSQPQPLWALFMDVNVSLVFYGTQLIDGKPEKCPVFLKKKVRMPCLPPVGARLSFIESKAMSVTAGIGGVAVRFVTWDESEPEVFQINCDYKQEQSLDYLDTQWLINEMGQVGWACDQEGD